MVRAGANSNASQCDAPIELVGDIDLEGIDALADLLIAAARRQQDAELPRAKNEQEELAHLHEGGPAARHAGKLDGYKQVDMEVG